VQSWVENFVSDLHQCAVQILYMCIIALGEEAFLKQYLKGLCHEIYIFGRYLLNSFQ